MLIPFGGNPLSIQRSGASCFTRRILCAQTTGPADCGASATRRHSRILPSRTTNVVRAVIPVPVPQVPGPGRSVRRNTAVVKPADEEVRSRRAPHGSASLKRRASRARAQDDRRGAVGHDAREREELGRAAHVAGAQRVGPVADHGCRRDGLLVSPNSSSSPPQPRQGRRARSGRPRTHGAHAPIILHPSSVRGDRRGRV